MPAADRAMWARLYAENATKGLPWAGSSPYPPLVTEVHAGALPRPGPILDVGCGVGTNAFWLSEQGYRVTGVDLASGAVEAAQHRAPGGRSSVRFLEDDILASALPPRSFGGAIDVGCFQTLATPLRKRYSKGLASALRPGATVLMFWVAREETGAWGPPHRLSVTDVTSALEREFLVQRVVHRPRSVALSAKIQRTVRPLTALAGYTVQLARRRSVQPPPR